MKRQTVGGYQGPVTIVSPDGSVVAGAACRYRAELDSSGNDHWQGQLHRIMPSGAVKEGVYKLQFPTGEEAEVTVQESSQRHDEFSFVGHGIRPLLPL